jgi:hypothetical protein
MALNHAATTGIAYNGDKLWHFESMVATGEYTEERGGMGERERGE